MDMFVDEIMYSKSAIDALIEDLRKPDNVDDYRRGWNNALGALAEELWKLED